MLYKSANTQLRYKAKMILCLTFLSILSVACSQDTGLQTSLDAAQTKFLNKEYDAAQSELLKAESMITDHTPLSEKEYLERLKGINYLELRVMDRAKHSLRKALEYSRQMNDTSRMIQNSFNLGLCNNTVDEAKEIYEYVIRLAAETEPVFVPQALEKLAQAYIYDNDFDNAQCSLDKAYKLAGGNNVIIQQITFTQCELWLAEDNLDAALSGFKSIPPDSCSLVGNLSRSEHIYSILYEIGEYKNALAYKDSIQLFSDSIKNINGANRVRHIEEEYTQNMEKERTRFKILFYSSLCAFIVIATVLFFIVKNLNLKQKQVALTNQIADLNVKLSELRPKEDQEENVEFNTDTESLHHLIMEKFRLSMEMFKTQPQYEILKKLNLIRDFDPANKQEIKDVSSEIIGRFSDACASIRQVVAAMTNDDCLLCSMSYCGCSKEVISAMMGSSEEAVRRRKSRIKQKLPEALFAFFFK